MEKVFIRQNAKRFLVGPKSNQQKKMRPVKTFRFNKTASNQNRQTARYNQKSQHRFRNYTLKYGHSTSNNVALSRIPMSNNNLRTARKGSYRSYGAHGTMIAEENLKGRNGTKTQTMAEFAGRLQSLPNAKLRNIYYKINASQFSRQNKQTLKKRALNWF